MRAGSREADPLVAMLTGLAVRLRVSAAAFVTVAALLSVTADHLAATIVAVVAYDAMAIGYVLVVRGTGFTPAVVAADVAVVSGIALMLRWLVPADAATSAAGWVFVATSFGIILAQFAGVFRWTVPLGVAATAAFVVGAHWAHAPDRGVTSTFTLALQLVIAAGLVAILRAAGRQAQTAARQHHDAAREQEAARLRRDAERTSLTVLHNGPLTTLTLVAQGGLSEETVVAVRAQAGIDLAVLGEGQGPDTIESVQLADLLDRTAAILRHRVDVQLSTVPCLVPSAVAQAFAGATAEALENVARHAGTGAARVRLEADDERVTVTIADSGRGFDPTAVPANRFGLRESIAGELRRVGGVARIRSRTGAGTGAGSDTGTGTAITLEWPE